MERKYIRKKNTTAVSETSGNIENYNSHVREIPEGEWKREREKDRGRERQRERDTSQ